MVNVMSMIRKKKAEFREMQQKKMQADNIKKANQLHELRKERIAVEGRANLEKLRQRELERIDKAKGPNKLQSFSNGLAGFMNRGGNKKKTVRFQKGSKVRKNGTLLGRIVGSDAPSDNRFGGQRNLDFGGSSSSDNPSRGMNNNPFSLGGSKGPSFGSQRSVPQKRQQQQPRVKVVVMQPRRQVVQKRRSIF